jgi:hypothetical protein
MNAVMIEKIDQVKWFHAMGFGDYICKGRMDNNVPRLIPFFWPRDDRE